jgi:predicted nucleic acid-binding protein
MYVDSSALLKRYVDEPDSDLAGDDDELSGAATYASRPTICAAYRV